MVVQVESAERQAFLFAREVFRSIIKDRGNEISLGRKHRKETKGYNSFRESREVRCLLLLYGFARGKSWTQVESNQPEEVEYLKPHLVRYLMAINKTVKEAGHSPLVMGDNAPEYLRG